MHRLLTKRLFLSCIEYTCNRGSGITSGKCIEYTCNRGSGITSGKCIEYTCNRGSDITSGKCIEYTCKGVRVSHPENVSEIFILFCELRCTICGQKINLAN